MNLKSNYFLALAVIGLSFVSCSETNNKQEAPNEEPVQDQEMVDFVDGMYDLDTDVSVINWGGSMVGVYGHFGNVYLQSGFIQTDGYVITGGSFTVDLSTITTTDSDDLYNMSSREDLVNHLKSDEFFSVEQYPTATFEITNVLETEIVGNLTIKGITLEQSIFNVDYMLLNGELSVSGDLVFNRQDFGVSYVNKMSDMVLSDRIKMHISLYGKYK